MKKIIEKILSHIQLKPQVKENHKEIIANHDTKSLKNLKVHVKKPDCVYTLIAQNALLRAQKNESISADKHQIIDIAIATLAIFDTFV